MPAPEALRREVKAERMMSIYQPAVDETLDAMADDEQVFDRGYAHVGDAVGYYFITDRGIHYCDSEKVGMFKKRFVSRFYPQSEIASASIDDMGQPTSAYLRIRNPEGKQSLVMWFEDELNDIPAYAQAQRAGRALEATG